MINFLLSLTHKIGFVNCLAVFFRDFQSCNDPIHPSPFSY